MKDVLGRPVPWGKEVAGQRVCLWLPYTRLLYGQPIDVRLETAQATEDPPYIRLAWDGLRQSIYLYWTTDRREPVTFVRWGYGGWSGVGGNGAEFRLKPTGKFARGQHLVPGKYRMHVVIDSKRFPGDPIRWVGRVESNTVEFEVFESDADGRARAIPEPVRERAPAMLADLDHADFARRERAEQELVKLGYDVLPLLDQFLHSPSQEARLRARRVFGKLTGPLFASEESPRRTFSDRKHRAALMSRLGEGAWKALGEQMNEETVEFWRVQSALVGPAPWFAEGDSLPADTVQRLLADLTNAKPHVRAAALRAVPRTTNEAILAALARCTADPYKTWEALVPDPYPTWPLADEAAWHAVPTQCRAIIEPLLAVARNVDNAWIRQRIFGSLALIGPDPRSLAYIRERVATGTEDQYAAVETLSKFGPETLPDLIKLAEAGKQPGQNPTIPRVAITELQHHGTAEFVGPFLMRMLRHDDLNIREAAIQVVDKISLRAALPELKRLAETQRLVWAVGAYARMADRKDAAALLLPWLDSKNLSERSSAVTFLGAIEHREAIPKILELLADSNLHVRLVADRALRGFANRPEGVGYDPNRPQPELWRALWRSKR